MPFAEKHKMMLQLLAGFFALWLVLWLFFFWGNSNRRAEADRQYAETIQKDIDEFTNKDAPALVGYLTTEYQRANQQLVADFQRVGSEILWKFPVPLIPPDVLPQNYTRVRLREERDYVDQQFSSIKNIHLAPAARSLGFDLPTIVTEEKSQDEIWMRQLLVVRRFVDVLLAVPDERREQAKRNEQAILTIDLIRPLTSATAGTPPAFLREHPVEVQMQITFAGLLKLLALCAQPETMHVIRFLEINSSPENRATRFSRERDDEELEIREWTWMTNYYLVHLVVASVESLPPAEQQAAVQTTAPAPRANTPIPH